MYAESGLARTVKTTQVNAGNVTKIDKLPRGQKQTVYADTDCQGAEKRTLKRDRTWHITPKRGSVQTMPKGELKERAYESNGSTNLERPFRALKRQFGHQKNVFQGAAQGHHPKY